MDLNGNDAVVPYDMVGNDRVVPDCIVPYDMVGNNRIVPDKK
ncbi:MAG: hypothetical protein PHH70_00265 [Candidatus Gracilibacteria bacterium]|nr:hypothetical protein [Candidatus Gracilibacteria bacterium]